MLNKYLIFSTIIIAIIPMVHSVSAESGGPIIEHVTQESIDPPAYKFMQGVDLKKGPVTIITNVFGVRDRYDNDIRIIDDQTLIKQYAGDIVIQPMKKGEKIFSYTFRKTNVTSFISLCQNGKLIAHSNREISNRIIFPHDLWKSGKKVDTPSEPYDIYSCPPDKK